MSPPLQNLRDLVLHCFLQVLSSAGLYNSMVWQQFKNNLKSNYAPLCSTLLSKWTDLLWRALKSVPLFDFIMLWWCSMFLGLNRDVMAPRSLKWWRVAPYRERKIQFSHTRTSGFFCWCLGGAWQQLSLGVPGVACWRSMPPRIHQGVRKEGTANKNIILVP